MSIALVCDNVSSCMRMFLTTNELYRILDGSFPREYGWTVSAAGDPDLCPTCTQNKRSAEERVAAYLDSFRRQEEGMIASPSTPTPTPTPTSTPPPTPMPTPPPTPSPPPAPAPTTMPTPPPTPTTMPAPAPAPAPSPAPAPAPTPTTTKGDHWTTN